MILSEIVNEYYIIIINQNLLTRQYKVETEKDSNCDWKGDMSNYNVDESINTQCKSILNVEWAQEKQCQSQGT